MASITVVGSINRDIVARVPHIPAPGETVLGISSAQHAGGKGANQAVAAARLRADPSTPVRLVGRVGRDGFGADMTAFLSAEDIDISAVTVSDTVATGLALISVDDAGENAIAVVSGANLDWPGGCPDLVLGPNDVVVCQLEIPLDVVIAAFAQAKAVGASTILNPAPYRDLPPALLTTTDFLVLNEIELGQMIGRETVRADDALFRAAREMLARGPRAVVVTLGAAGVAIVDTFGRAERIAGCAVAAIDTTGAGDCFVGALAAAHVDGHDLRTAAQFANTAAAVSVTRAGAASSIPRREDVA